MSDGAKMGGGWLRHFSEGKWPLFLPILFFAPTLFMGLSADDLFHKAIIQGDFEPFVGKNEPILDLFSFFPQDPRVQALIQDWGLAPWWTVEGIHASFFRPVTAMTHLLDYALWPELPIMHHLHSLLWFVLAAWAVRRLFRTTGLTSVALGLAVFFFLVEDAHAMPVIWIANRNIMIAAFFGALAIEAYIKWRRAEGPLYQVLLFMVMGLLAAEAGLCAFGYMLAWSLVYETDWQRKVTATLPIIVLVITWRVVYNAMGYG